MYVLFLIVQMVITVSCPAFKVMDVYWITTMAYGHLVSSEGLLNPIVRRDDWVLFYKQVVRFDAKFDGIRNYFTSMPSE